MLQNLINSHPNARCFFELFHRHQSRISFGVKGYSRRSNTPNLIRQRNDDPVSFVERYIFGRHSSDILAVGFKMLYSQCRRGIQFWDEPRFSFWWQNIGKEPKWEKGDRDLWSYLVEKKISIIHLTRNNVLEGKISAMLAQNTGKWGIGATGGRNVHQYNKKIYVNPNEFRIDLEGEKLFRAEIRQIFKNNPLLELTYEELVDVGGSSHSKLIKFLNLPKADLVTPTVKLSNYDIRDVIENYLESLTSNNQNNPKISPLVESLTGVIPSHNLNEKDDYGNYLSEKYS